MQQDIPATSTPPSCPRRLLNERVYLERAEEALQPPMIGARQIRLRYQQTPPQILVNDAGMIIEPNLKG